MSSFVGGTGFGKTQPIFKHSNQRFWYKLPETQYDPDKNTLKEEKTEMNHLNEKKILRVFIQRNTFNDRCIAIKNRYQLVKCFRLKLLHGKDMKTLLTCLKTNESDFDRVLENHCRECDLKNDYD